MPLNEIAYPFCTIGIDLGGTKISAGILFYDSENRKPSIVNQTRIHTQGDQGREVILSNIYKVARLNMDFHRESEYSGYPIVGVGLGAAGRNNKKTGVVDSATNVLDNWAGTPLVASLEEELGLPAVVVGDVQAHGFGEVTWGIGRDSDCMFMVAAGTGVGSAIFFEKTLVNGAHGYAGEIGHVPCPDSKGFMCTCGSTSGHLEAVGGGWGIENCYHDAGGEKLSCADISKLANKGEELAVKIIEKAARSLALMIIFISVYLDIDTVVVSGSVAKSGPVWQNCFNRTTKEYFPPGFIFPKIAKPELGDEAAIFGSSEALLSMKFTINS
ncbi:MAG: ROK family protein [Eggerthellaceae bacterium]|nr:ROK family protein [Eggerthellaceae bacterium]